MPGYPKSSLPEAHLFSLHAALAPEELWKALERLLSRTVPAHTCNFFLNIPDLGRPQVMFSTSREMRNMPPYKLAHALKVSGILPFLAANPGVRVVSLQSVYPHRKDLEQSEYYKTYLRPNGWEDVIGLPLWKGSRMIGFVALLRSATEKRFDSTDLENAQRLHASINTAAQRVLRAYREKSVRLSLQRIVREENHPVVLLNWEGDVVFVTRSARELLVQWSGKNASLRLQRNRKPKLPKPVTSCVRDLRARYLGALEAGGPSEAIPGMIVPLANRMEVSAEVRLVTEPKASSLTMPSLMIKFQRLGPRHSLSGENPLPLDLLTEREHKVVDLLSRGFSNAEIARKLGRTVGSVKQQLSVIYSKLGVRSRSQLIARSR